ADDDRDHSPEEVIAYEYGQRAGDDCSDHQVGSEPHEEQAPRVAVPFGRGNRINVVLLNAEDAMLPSFCARIHSHYELPETSWVVADSEPIEAAGSSRPPVAGVRGLWMGSSPREGPNRYWLKRCRCTDISVAARSASPASMAPRMARCSFTCSSCAS